jgi:hypothetical protein
MKPHFQISPFTHSLKMDSRPGLAPGKTWVAAKRLDSFGMREMGDLI